MTKPVRVAIYARVSTDGQTVEHQLRDLGEISEVPELKPSLLAILHPLPAAEGISGGIILDFIHLLTSGHPSSHYAA